MKRTFSVVVTASIVAGRSSCSMVLYELNTITFSHPVYIDMPLSILPQIFDPT